MTPQINYETNPQANPTPRCLAALPGAVGPTGRPADAAFASERSGPGMRMEDQESAERRAELELETWEWKRQMMCRELTRAAHLRCMALLTAGVARRVRIDKLTGERITAPPDMRSSIPAAALMRQFDSLGRAASIDLIQARRARRPRQTRPRKVQAPARRIIGSFTLGDGFGDLCAPAPTRTSGEAGSAGQPLGSAPGTAANQPRKARSGLGAAARSENIISPEIITGQAQRQASSARCG